MELRKEGSDGEFKRSSFIKFGRKREIEKQRLDRVKKGGREEEKQNE